MITLEELKRRHSLVRWMLLISLLLFLLGLFALVSHWTAAIPLIAFACLFRLTAVWLARRRYNAAWMQASASAAAATVMENPRYQAQEDAPEDLPVRLGLMPSAALTPGARLHHVLRGTLAGVNVTIAEAAFVRAGTQGGTVSGTLLTAEGALPPEENWVLLWRRPLDGLLPLSEYYRLWTVLKQPASLPQPDGVCFTAGGASESLDIASGILRPYCRESAIALAARDGKLSLLLPGTFYAQKPDITVVPTEEALNTVSLPGLDILQKLLRKI